MSNSAQVDTTPVNTTRLRSAKSIDFLDQNLEQTGLGKIFFPDRFVPDFWEKYFFRRPVCSRFWRNLFFWVWEIYFFQIPVCSRICDITGLRTKIKISRAVELRSSKFWKFWKATNLLFHPSTTFMGLWATLLKWIQLQSTQPGSGRRNPLIFWTRIWNKPVWEKFFSQTGLFQISGKNIFFAGRFVPGEKNFFESVLTSNTKDHMEWYPLVYS